MPADAARAWSIQRASACARAESVGSVVPDMDRQRFTTHQPCGMRARSRSADRRSASRTGVFSGSVTITTSVWRRSRRRGRRSRTLAGTSPPVCSIWRP